MQPDERNAAYLFDMLEAAEKIQRYIAGKGFLNMNGLVPKLHLGTTKELPSTAWERGLIRKKE